jgi:hypothetical protein
MQITARSISVADLFGKLEEQQARKVDIVVRAADLAADQNMIRLSGQESILRPSGVTDPNGLYLPLDTFLIHLSGKFGIPLDYLRRMHTDRPDIFADNINGWIHGYATTDADGDYENKAAPDTRNFLFRGFIDDAGEQVARGLLGDTYKIVDNLDTVAATLAGLAEAGVEAVGSADISDRHMYLRLIAPGVEVAARELLKGYRDPFADGGEVRVGGGFDLSGVRRAAAAEGTAYTPGAEPVLNAGIKVKNSELGFSSTSITPYAHFQICGNGQTCEVDVVRAIHHGGRQDTGAVDWSEDTRQKELALMTAKVRDSVASFMSAGYWERKVAEWTAKAGKPVDDAEATIGQVSKSLGFTEDERSTIFRHFLLGGQRTAGGVMNAITSAAQTIENADRAAEFEGVAVQALDLV